MEHQIIKIYGEHNEYLYKIMNGGAKQRVIKGKYNDINKKINQSIEKCKTDIEENNYFMMTNRLLINTLLKEKLYERSKRREIDKKKNIIIIVGGLITILTNITQFLINKYI